MARRGAGRRKLFDPVRAMARSPRTVHMIPVFAATDEPGWLVFTNKEKEKIAQFFHTMPSECSSWEPPVKSWFIHHACIGYAIECMQRAYTDQFIVFCEQCRSGFPCDRWNKVPQLDYVVRSPDMTAMSMENPYTSRTQPWSWPNGAPEEPQINFRVTFIPMPVSAEFLRDVVSDFFGAANTIFTRMRNAQRPPRQGRLPQDIGIPPEEAAAVLGIRWPCTLEQMNTAYRSAAMAAHPDRGGSNEAMSKINQARDALMKHLAPVRNVEPDAKQ